MQHKKYKAVGIMSGTSLDGLDLVLCDFTYNSSSWSYNILDCKTIEYSTELKTKLSQAQELNAYDFVKLHRHYGKFIGEQVVNFVGKIKDIDFVASHGHTVFHEPKKQISFQIGCGAQIAATCGFNVISDFRTLDIALGGQGAPLVPIGDRLLFSEYDACINLGGFANISYEKLNKRIAFDICPVNIVLNEITNKEFDLLYDKDGQLGKKGNLNKQLFHKLNQIPFYYQTPPKSLGREWVEENFTPILREHLHININDILTTCYHHFANQLANILNSNHLKRALFTGGGAYNKFLIQLISEYTNTKIIIPQNEVIDFKEALIFAFLGVLRLENKENCLASVTGATKDNIGGCIYIG